MKEGPKAYCGKGRVVRLPGSLYPDRLETSFNAQDLVTLDRFRNERGYVHVLWTRMLRPDAQGNTHYGSISRLPKMDKLVPLTPPPQLYPQIKTHHNDEDIPK